MLSEHNRNIALGIIAFFILVLIGVGVYDYAHITGPAPVPSAQAPAMASTTSHAADLVAGGPYQMKVTKGITYATVGTTTLTITLYQPIGAKYPTPFVAFTHGGGYVGGNVDGSKDLAQKIVSRGYTFASIDYQTSDVAAMPAPIQDDLGGIRFLRAHAAEYNLDPTRVVTMGNSAGSDLAVLVAVVANDSSYWGSVGGNTDQSNSVQGAVGISGVWGSHEANELDQKHLDERAAELGCSGITSPDCADKIKAYYPEFHVDSGDPPTLILQGGKNDNAPPENAQGVADAMKAAGVDVTLYVDPNLGDNIANAMNHLDMIYAFLDRVFAK